VVRAPAYLLVAGLTLLSGCSVGSGGASSSTPPLTPGSGTTSSASQRPEPYQPTDADRTQIRTLLKHRAAAVLHHDEGAFMDTVDPADGGFVTQQRTLFANLAKLPVASMRYAVDDASGLPVADVSGADPTFRPTVVEQVRLSGVDDHPVGNPLEDTFVRRDGRWLLGAESLPGSYDDEDAQSRPWAGGVPIAVASDGPMLVLVDADRARSAAALARTIDADIRTDAQVLGVAPTFHVLVDATSVGAVDKMNTVDDREAAAVTMPVFGISLDRYTSLAGIRIKINPDDAAQIVADPHVVRHELTHYLTFRRLLGAPTWLKEGLAEYVSVQPAAFGEVPVAPGAVEHAVGLPHDLPTTAKWGLDPDADYLVARAAVTYLAGKCGVAPLLALARAYRRIPGDDPDQKTDRVLRHALGLTRAALESATWALLAGLP
jgi:hypothetical protein